MFLSFKDNWKRFSSKRNTILSIICNMRSVAVLNGRYTNTKKMMMMMMMIVIIAQLSSSPNCHQFFIFALWSFIVFDYYTAHPPSMLFRFLYLDISFSYIMVCKVRWILQSTTELLNHSFKDEITWSCFIILRNHVLILCVLKDIYYHVSMLVHANSICVVCLSTGLIF